MKYKAISISMFDFSNIYKYTTLQTEISGGKSDRFVSMVVIKSSFESLGIGPFELTVENYTDCLLIKLL